MSHPKMQHYVPQFLLNKFALPNKKQIHVYDKSNDNTFVASIRKVAAKKKFYDFTINGEDISIEKNLSYIEGLAASEIAEIINTGSIGHLTDERKRRLAYYILIQQNRGMHLRDSIDSMVAQTRERLSNEGHDPDSIPQLKLMNENDKKVLTAQFLKKSEEFIPILLDKEWALLEAPRDIPLYISDNPVSLYNELNDPLRGNIGIAVKGIQISIPIHKRYSLELYCKTLKKYVDEMRKDTNPGDAIPIDEANVEHFNSRQVKASSRFVFSNDGNFKLVQEMIAQNPKMRHGFFPELVANNNPSPPRQ